MEQMEIQHNKEMFNITQQMQKQIMEQEEKYNKQMLFKKKVTERQIELLETHWKEKLDQVQVELTKI